MKINGIHTPTELSTRNQQTLYLCNHHANESKLSKKNENIFLK